MNNLIKQIRFSSLWKIELPELASSVIEIVEKHNPETLKIKVFFDLLVEQEPQIKLLEVRYGPHPITKKMIAMRKRRKALIQGIPNRLMTIEKGGKASAIEHLEVVQPVVNRYLNGLSRSNLKTTSQQVTQFLQHFSENEALQTAIEALDMVSYIDDLQSVHTALGEQYGDRRASVSARPDVKTDTLVKSVLTAMINLFKSIDLANVENKAIDYTPLIGELNNELTTYGALINGRASYYKNKADKVVDNVEVVGDKSGDSSEPIQSVSRMYPMNAEMENEDNFGEVDKKRTVAVSTKQTLLPDISTEV